MLTSISSLVLASIIWLSYDQYSTKKFLNEEIKVLANVIANRSHAAILFGDVELARTNLQSLQARKTINTACIYRSTSNTSQNESNTLFAEYHTSNSDIGCPQSSHLQQLIDNDYVLHKKNHIDLLETINLEGKKIGFLLIRSSLDEMNTRLRNKTLVLFGVIFIAASLALWMASMLEKLISTPLLALGRTAQTVAENDDYSIRANKHGKDEIGQVVDSFNHMLTKIEQEDTKLRESEEKFRLFSASSSVGIFQTDSKGACIYANERLSEITGLPHQQLISQGWLSAVHEDDFERIDQSWQRSLIHGESLRIRVRLSGDSDEVSWITGHIDPLNNSKGEAIGFLGTVSDITDLKNAQLQLEHLAFYDVLTGLANRRLFRDRLETILTSSARLKTTVALLFIDIDHFKNTNDTLGHDTGDTLLRILADRLQHCVRASDTVARMGGDEFTTVLVDVKNSYAVSKIAEYILEEIGKPIHLNNQEINVTASIGIVLSPDNGDSAETLIKHADLALYRAKDEGRNNYQFFIEDMNSHLVEHLAFIKDFKEALTKDEFTLHYQPQFQLSDHKIIGFEALVRWISPKRGFVSPVDFIPIAEETGLIIQLGDWILKEACTQMKSLIDDKIVTPDTVIAVNMSTKQLIQEDLIEAIQHTLLSTGLSPSQLELEITESMLMENMDRGIKNLNALNELGISLSIDDFGTGYSSLGYLKTLPVHIVKVDRSFVKDIPDDKDDMAITAAVVAMAHKLNYKVVAEGIEIEEQLQFLRDCNCDYGQGYMFSRPLPPDELREFCLEQTEIQNQSAS